MHKGHDRPGRCKPVADQLELSQSDISVIQYRRKTAVPEKPRNRRHQRLEFKGEDTGRRMSSEERDIEEWHVISAVLQGEVVEFRILVQRYQHPIYHLMLRLTRQAMAAEDLTQDAFTRAYEKLNTFKKGHRFFSWLYTIAVNIGRDYLRRKELQNDLFSSEPLDMEWPDRHAGDCARQPDCVAVVGDVRDALNRLPVRYSETMLLYYREGLSAREIAGALNISIAAVKVRIFRGRKMLKQQLGGEYETNR